MSHSANYDGVNFQFNSDFSGLLTIQYGLDIVTIPTSSILKLVAFHYVRYNKISQLESLNTPDNILLGGK